MANFCQQRENVIFSDAKSAVLKKKAGQTKYNPVICSSSTELSPAILHLAATWLLLTHAVQSEVFQHTLMLQTTFKSFSFCNTEPKQTLESQKLQQNSSVIAPWPALILTPEEPDGRTTDTLRAARALLQAVPSHTLPPGASNTRRWRKPQTLHISQGKIIPCFSSPEGGWGKNNL